MSKQIAPKQTLTLLVEQLINDTVAKAAEFYKAGRPGRGHYELVRGGLRIARLVGAVESARELADLKLVEPLYDPASNTTALEAVNGGAA